jgi:hypothetical protein
MPGPSSTRTRSVLTSNAAEQEAAQHELLPPPSSSQVLVVKRRQQLKCGTCNSSPTFEVGALVTAAWLEKGDEYGFWYDGVVRNAMCKCSSMASEGESANGSKATTTWSYDIAFVEDGREDDDLAGVWVWSRQAYHKSVATTREEGTPKQQVSDATSSRILRQCRTWQCEFKGCTFADDDHETVAAHERSCLKRPSLKHHQLPRDDMHSRSQSLDAAATSAAIVTPPVPVADLDDVVVAAMTRTKTGRLTATHETPVGATNHAVQEVPVSANASLSLNPAAAITNDSLPPGWSHTKRRSRKDARARIDHVYTSPTGYRCRSLKEVMRYVSNEDSSSSSKGQHTPSSKEAEDREDVVYGSTAEENGTGHQQHTSTTKRRATACPPLKRPVNDAMDDDHFETYLHQEAATVTEKTKKRRRINYYPSSEDNKCSSSDDSEKEDGRFAELLRNVLMANSTLTSDSSEQQHLLGSQGDDVLCGSGVDIAAAGSAGEELVDATVANMIASRRAAAAAARAKWRDTLARLDKDSSGIVWE